MAECRVQQVRIACWLLARGHSVSASPSKAVTLESKGGPRAHPRGGPGPGGLGVAAALRGPRALPGLAQVAAGLQRAAQRAPGQVQDRGHQRHRLLHHAPRIRLPGIRLGLWSKPCPVPTDGLEHVRDIKLEKCMYIQDQCLQRLSETSSLQRSLQQLQIISCGNVTDTGVLALHRLANLKYLYLSDLPGIREKEKTFRVLQQALPKLELELDLE
ncbi:ATP synthase subunit s, mitochondrial isoform X2 [Zonotrichia albicollis]|uniref:ATP synthase subunit s, mitochondrial isoform X2 n=1 Tax=Zonotrichia albicollis TaxID=44394 RepID=UPI003D8109CE